MCIDVETVLVCGMETHVLSQHYACCNLGGAKWRVVLPWASLRNSIYAAAGMAPRGVLRCHEPPFATLDMPRQGGAKGVAGVAIGGCAIRRGTLRGDEIQSNLVLRDPTAMHPSTRGTK